MCVWKILFYCNFELNILLHKVISRKKENSSRDKINASVVVGTVRKSTVIAV